MAPSPDRSARSAAWRYVSAIVGAASYGPLRARFGGRTAYVAGGFVYLAATAGCALAPDIRLFLAARLPVQFRPEHRFLVAINERARVVHQHFLRYAAEGREGTFQAREPALLAFVPECPHVAPPRVPERRNFARLPGLP